MLVVVRLRRPPCTVWRHGSTSTEADAQCADQARIRSDTKFVAILRTVDGGVSMPTVMSLLEITVGRHHVRRHRRRRRQDSLSP